MNWRTYSRLTALPGILSALVACQTQPPAKLDDEALASLRKIHSVALLPPQVEYRLISPGTEERLPRDEQEVAAQLAPKLEQLLAGRQLEVRKPGSDASAIRLVGELQSALDDIVPRVSPPQAQDVPIHASISAALAGRAGERIGADAILWSRYDAYRKSGKAQILDIFSGTLQTALTGRQPATDGPEAGTLTMALVDAGTGRVLWAGAAKIIKGGWNATVPNTAASVFATLPAATETKAR